MAAAQQAAAAFMRALWPDSPAETAGRFTRAMMELTEGCDASPADHLDKQFEVDVPGMWIVSRDIPFTSLCEHHVMPFTGTATIAYLPRPGGRVVGLSKLARMTQGFAARLQVQERLTGQVFNAVADKLAPEAAYVRIEAQHSCQRLRGAKTCSGSMATVFTNAKPDQLAVLRMALGEV